MSMKAFVRGPRTLLWIIGLSAVACLLAVALFLRARFTSYQAQADRIQVEVAAIRGLPFKHHVDAQRQSSREFLQYVDRQLGRQPPDPEYGGVVRILGLHRGSLIDHPEVLVRQLITIGANGYYDPSRKQLFIVRDVPEPRRSSVFAHELYHALQDQYFGVESYELGEHDGALNTDEQLARRAVVEGEAAYIQMIFAVKAASGRAPTHEIMGEIIRRQPEGDKESIRAVLRKPELAARAGKDTLAAFEKLESIPAFMWETFIGVNQRGAAFIHAVQRQGWAEVEKLYREYPPASTEQILHPEKWFARELPIAIEWPVFDETPMSADWKLLQQDVLGEFQWRIVFRENGLASESAAAAAGWGGDRYVIFKSTRSGKLLMLMYTSWDTDADALEFARAYRRVLETKYAADPAPARMLQKGPDVLIVEGGEESSRAAFMTFAEMARKRAQVSR